MSSSLLDVACPCEVETPHSARTVSSLFLPLAKADMKRPMAREVKQLSNITPHGEEKQVMKSPPP